MAFSQGSRSQLAFKKETTFGTTPAGNFTNLPFTSHALTLGKERVAGQDIQSDRMPRVDRHGNRSVSGDIVCDLRHAVYDPLIESALMTDNDFATGFSSGNATSVTNAAILGTTPNFISVEDYAVDVDQAQLFTGMTVNTMGVSIAPNAMVTATFGMLGKNMSVSQTQKTVDASAGNEPFDAYSGSVKLGNKGTLGSALTIITAVDFTLDNGFNPTFVVGSDSAPQFEFGTASIEGTVSAYFEDTIMLNRFLNETESSLEVVVGDPESTPRTLTFTFPRIKINSADIGVDGATSRIVNMSFVALRDDTDLTSSATDANTMIKITKSAA